VLVEPEALGLGLGWADRPPPVRAIVDVVERVERSPRAHPLWKVERPAGRGMPAARAEMWRQPQGELWFAMTAMDGDDECVILELSVDERSGCVAIATPEGNEHALFEGLGSVALPTLAQSHGSLVLHASCCSLKGRATLITALGGSGKSSLLAGLVAAGWEALSEDQCVIDLSGRSPMVWPGPNWVSLSHEVSVPQPIRTVRFSAQAKVAWDLDPWTRRAPAQLSRIVVLEPAGGREPVWERIEPGMMIGVLARQTPWHQEHDRFGQEVFGKLVDVAARVPCHRLRLPRSPQWLPRAMALLTGGPDGSRRVVR
jgi:hypothetical protein